MGIKCSKRKNKSFRNEIIQAQPIQMSLTTSKEALAFCDSQDLANFMRTKPVKSYIQEVIWKQQIYFDSCEQLTRIIEGKSEILLRSYNDFTEKALKIKLMVLKYYKENFLAYQEQVPECIEKKDWIANETMQILIETNIILNCLMDKNFDVEQELWWGNDYFKDRIQSLGANGEEKIQNDQIVQPIVQYLQALKNKVTQSMPINQQQQRPYQQNQSVVNSTAIAQVHLTKFYNDLKLEFAKDAGEEQVSS
ncbi:unnamed protein product (macronuclear) [Paramecium tetraurelia]|uniref:Uncharacterized protein n=1 Tax=Paramecium tetraurelia TaxID=5888 RepID=A0DUA7_PARTE|nr:uncharacterized protein GSPATT00020296001 [Paramecium tetraurelia]CAK86624.1 unnamed protein product [Paramecium tetraurelia]|eukprot:XP_001454021.1 hypothetical protein (macronuclear) [Paramecium tetraurelia strain d4-2]